MRIGIDAKWYYSGPPSGINVVRNIVDNLIEYNFNDEIVFFLNKEDISQKEHFKAKIRNKNNLSFFFIPGMVNFITNLFFFPFYFQKCKLDVIMFQNYIPVWGGSKTKYIDYVHDFLFLDYPQYFTKIELAVYRLMIFSVKKAEYVITISQSERKRIFTHSKISPDKISYVYHGLDPIFFERSDDIKAKIKKKYNLPETFILYVGRLNIRKNITTLLKSLSIAKHKHSLVIVGKADNKGFNLDDEIARLGIKDRVFNIGYLVDIDLAEIISSASVFVFPSYAEGFGLPPLEAMKSGIPTIVSDRTSLPEICGNAALYFDPDNPEDLALKIDLLLSNPKVYSDFKILGKNRSSEFSWQKSVENILNIFKNRKNEA
jgi:glycosyltransferase involved in cell wall biosynthesis